MRKCFLTAISVMAVAFLLCACSDQATDVKVDDGSAGVASEADSTSLTTSVEHFGQKETTPEDPSEKVWIIATDIDFKPFEFTDQDDKLTGLDIDLFEAIAKDQGFKYDIQAVGWDASLEACELKEAAGMIAGASVTQERIADGWIFSDGYIDVNQCMAVSAGSNISGFEDLKGERVGVKAETLSAQYAESLAEEYDFSIEYFLDSTELYRSVIGGRCAACFDDAPVLDYVIRDSGLELKIVEGTGNDSLSCALVVFYDENRELIDMFNKGLADIKADGTYDKIIEKYIGD